ncbi:MAG: MFS transporter, partial [Microbacteriaceae bacterium]|nr:MFS transporter [Microbacteriaceae bacterium]
MPRPSASEVFRNANFSLFFSAQLISHTGMWFQNLTLALIIVERTASASALAYVSVAQFTPLLLLAGVVGKIADTISPRIVLTITAACSAVVACGLEFFVSLPAVDLIWLYALVVLAGCVSAFERISSQAFIFELVGGDLLKNAVVLNTVAVSVARSIGPGLAGVVYLAFGPVVCLYVTAVAFGLVATLMLLIRASKLTPRRTTSTQKQSLKTLFAEIRRNIDLRVVLIINAVITVAALGMNVVLTAAVTITFEGDAGDLGLMHVLNAAGAIVGGYLLTRTEKVSASTLGAALLGLSVSLA